VEIAGDRVTARSVAQAMSKLTGTLFNLQFTGTLSLLAKAVRRFSTSKDTAFPAWQGMQYFASSSTAWPSCGARTTTGTVCSPGRRCAPCSPSTWRASPRSFRPPTSSAVVSTLIREKPAGYAS